jgi:hypothetical protein
VIPARIEVAPLREGEERVVSLTVKAGDKVAKGLYPIAFTPVGMPAARQELMASAGAVISVDRRLPEMMQFVVRAPGYTIKVDARSGVSYYLLDADGHRRHGSLYNSNFQFGIPSIEGSARFGTPCGFVWEGSNTLQVGADPARLLYTFYEDRMVFALVRPTDPNKTFTMWLGTFDNLGKPVHQGIQEQPWKPIVADWIFFPHRGLPAGTVGPPPAEGPRVRPRRGAQLPHQGRPAGHAEVRHPGGS